MSAERVEDSEENRRECRLAKRYTVVCVTCRASVAWFTEPDKLKIEA